MEAPAWPQPSLPDLLAALEQAEAPSFGLCECGCGLAAPIATQTMRRRGWIKGQPVRFIRGHNASVQPRQDLAARFWPKVNKNGPIIRPALGPCWLWIGARDRKDYGLIKVNGRSRRATPHRPR